MSAADLQQIAIERRAKVQEFQRSHRVAVLTLVFTDIIGSTKLKQDLGDQEAVSAIQRHHAEIREILSRFSQGEEVETAGDSFFIVFTNPSDAVKFSLLAQARLRVLAMETARPIFDRIGIHVGEVLVEDEVGRGRAEALYGIQVDTCARVQSLAQGDQILLTRFAFDEARRSLSFDALNGVDSLSWLNYGPYNLKGVEEPIEICEVGELGKAKLGRPPDTEKAYRFLPADSEPVLGWRPAVGQQVPGTSWVLAKKLGEGGFGEVWLGRDKRLKTEHVFKFCFRADRVRSLKREVTLFRLLKERVGDHPNIVGIEQVYFDEAPFYIVMQHVEGEDLPAWCETHGGVDKVPVATRLEIVAQVADALQAAHDSGVIHRDVKPSNILVGGQVDVHAYLTDFGIGQVVSEEVLSRLTHSGFTQTIEGSSSRSGTQLYMAPELFSGKPASIRSDIYALGVVLYQLVAGDFGRAVTTDWAKQITDPLLREDLGKCFAGDPQERFAGPGQLAEQLRHLKERRAASERQQTLLSEREQAAYRRRALRIGALVLVVTAIVVGLVIHTFVERQNADAAKSLAEERERDAKAMLLLNQADQESRADNDETALALTRAAYLKQPSFQTRSALINRLLQASPHFKQAFSLGGDGVSALAWSADSQKFAVGLRSGSIQFWTEGQPLTLIANRRAKENELTGVLDLCFAEEGKSIAAIFESGEFQTYPFGSTSRQKGTILQKSFLALGAVSPDGKRVAYAHTDPLPPDVRDPGGEDTLAISAGSSGDPTCLRFSSDSARLAIGFHEGAVELLQPSKTTTCRNIDGRIVLAAAWQPQGSLLAIGLQSYGLEIWETNPVRLELVERLPAENNITSLDWNPVHQQLALAVGRQVKLWRLSKKDPRPNAMLKISFVANHQSNINTVRWSPDGQWLASGDDNGIVKIWNLKQEGVARYLDGGCPLHGLDSSPDGRWISVGTEDGRLLTWSTGGSDAIENEIKIGNKGVNCVAWQPKGDTLACGDTAGAIQLYRSPWSKPSEQLVTAHGEIWQLKWSPDGQTLFFTSHDGTVNSWNPKESEARVLQTAPGAALGLAVSPDGARLAASSTDGYITVQRLADGHIVAHYKVHADSIGCLAWSPDGRRLASGGNDGIVGLSDPGTNAVIQRFPTSTATSDVPFVEAVDFSPDGKQIVAVGYDGNIRDWDSATGEALWQAGIHGKRIWQVRWSTAALLLTSSSDGHVGCLDPREKSWVERAGELTRHLPSERTGQ